jgi:hypothetical protein
MGKSYNTPRLNKAMQQMFFTVHKCPINAQ